MTDTMTYTGELTILTCWCGIKHAVPDTLRRYQLNQHDMGINFSVYCPLGHQHVPSGDSRAKKLERELAAAKAMAAREQQRHDQTKAELRETEARRRGEKAAKTRIKNRVQHGVCPCCNRTFQDLARHMAGQHPDYATIEQP